MIYSYYNNNFVPNLNFDWHLSKFNLKIMIKQSINKINIILNNTSRGKNEF